MMKKKKTRLKRLIAREFVIEWLAAFIDVEWQRQKWCIVENVGYYYTLEQVQCYFFHALKIGDFIHHGEPKEATVYGSMYIDNFLYTRQEADLFYDCCFALDDFIEKTMQDYWTKEEELGKESGTGVPDEEYFNSPYLPKLMDESKKLLEVMVFNNRKYGNKKYQSIEEIDWKGVRHFDVPLIEY
ncbi:hypothetical protein [Rickettsia endosymbiont of Cardiosporidium cionae]|uniref:hypothetical protein n=1 Tax=Rickettsia endosymbiont of Cardiosporidium cionae TaxID=2777155 RepID=UPI001893D0AB|nr:hypothetical protein [Rickettsia endosymbiont of Cardiosporidium cionae]KAF8818061.1 hypothetical protein IHI24_000898 [Rickettsia endosymbiont of Cardiosporidium cionae]